MDLTTITVVDFKAQFPRGFPYLPNWSNSVTYNLNDIVYYTNGLFYKSLINGNVSLPTNATNWIQYTADVQDYVLDSDIMNAFAEAQLVFNQALFTSDAFVTLGYLYLTAHAGVTTTGSYPVSGRTVGSVSENYSIPDQYLKNPLFLFYNKTGYGQKYLSFIQPMLVGNVISVIGTTLP